MAVLCQKYSAIFAHLPVAVRGGELQKQDSTITGGLGQTTVPTVDRQLQLQHISVYLLHANSDKYHHSVARQCKYTVVRSTSQSYGDSKILGAQNSKTPEPIDKKFGVGAYIRMPKLKIIAPLGAWRRIRD